MLRAAGRLVGGYALGHRELRLLYAATFLSFLGASITFPLRMLYAEAHGASPAELGLLAAAFLVGQMVAQLPMGWLIDRWGRVPVLVAVLIIHPILTILYVPLNAPVDLIVLRLLEGVTIAGAQPAINAYIVDVTPAEHRSEAYGALGATLNAGLLLGPLFGGLIGQGFGFRAAFVTNFVVEALALPLVLGRVREPIVHEERRVEGRVPLAELFTFPLVGAYVSLLTIQSVIGVLSGVWAIWIHDLGGSYIYIGFSFSVFALPQIVFGAMAGRLVDRWGRARFILVSGLGAGVIYAAYGFMHNLILILVVGVLEGIVILFLQPATQGLLADASPARARGRAQGIAAFVGSVGGAGTAFLSLPLYHESHPTPFVLAGSIMAIGSIVTAAAAVAFIRRQTGSPVEKAAPYSG